MLGAIIHFVLTCRRCSFSSPRFRYALPGPQPSGTLTVTAGGPPCEGQLVDDGSRLCDSSWVLNYSLRSGVQGPQHPAPGASFSGTQRQAYLPQNSAGARAVQQLIRAWGAGHIFMVGKSVTTGAENTTVWAGIHQKTRPSGGATHHGWPDPTYFDRLTNECASRNIYADGDRPAALAAGAGGGGRAGAGGAGAAAAPAAPPAAPAAPAAAAAVAAADPATIALRADLADLQCQLQQAMQSQDRTKIADLMRRRAATQAKLAS